MLDYLRHASVRDVVVSARHRQHAHPAARAFVAALLDLPNIKTCGSPPKG